MITSPGNVRIKSIVRMQQKARARREADAFLAEGIKMFLEAPVERIREVYLSEAAKRGAVAYVSEVSYARGKGLTGFVVSDIRKAMAVISGVFFAYEPGRPQLTGITGTKGKTTTAWYLKSMLDEWKREQGEP